MTVYIIAAVAANGVIGRNNRIPWNNHAEMQFFKAQTTGHPVIMGRKTHESIGRMLPQRHNIVLSLSGTGLTDALQQAKDCGTGKTFIIGGEQIYREALKQGVVDTVLLSQLKHDYEGDTHFPFDVMDNYGLTDVLDYISFKVYKYVRTGMFDG